MALRRQSLIKRGVKRGGVATEPRPIPESLYPGNWDIEMTPSTAGSCSKKELKFVAPWLKPTDFLDGEVLNREAIRIHEYLHLQLSPEGADSHPLIEDLKERHESETDLEVKCIIHSFLKDTLKGVKALEDLRVNEIAVQGSDQRIKDAITNHMVSDESLKSILSTLTGMEKAKVKGVKDIKNLHLAAASVSHTGMSKRLAPINAKLEDILPPHYNNLLTEAISEVKEEQTFDSVVRNAMLLAFETYKEALSELAEKRSKTSSKKSSKVGDEVSDKPTKMPKLSKSDGDIPWGTMSIEYPPRPFKMKPPRMHVRRDSGFIPRSPERLLTDGLAFKEKIMCEEPLGTILIDMSGSMSINPSHIIQLLKSDMEVTVAGYSGGGKGTYSKGELYILADRLTCITKVPEHGPGNVVDGPALEWLITQKPPFTWISDGMVTGVGDNTCEKQNVYVNDFIKAHGIKQVPNMSQFFKLHNITYKKEEV